jgi:glycosyltransferase involved in cell wall biosynthesis
MMRAQSDGDTERDPSSEPAGQAAETAAQEAGAATPAFSVIINNYNYIAFLPDAVESVLRQTHADYELIIVDDGSTDGSVEYIRSLDTDLVLVQTNRLGQARACLEAFRHARGRYIYVLDADDFAFDDLLRTAALAIGDEPTKVQFRLVPTDAEGRPFADPTPDIAAGDDAAKQRSAIYRTGMPLTPPTSGNIFHRRVLEAVGDISYETAIDGITLLAAPFLGPVVTLSRPLGAYRVHTLGHSAHANPLDAGRIARDRERFRGRIAHLNGILATLEPPASPVKAADSFFYVWDCLTLEAAMTGAAIRPGTLLAFVRRLFAEHGFTIFTLRKLAWLVIAVAAPNAVKLRFARARMNPWPRRRVGSPPVIESR